MSILKTIESKLHEALSPKFLKVADDSAAHYGHDGASPGHISHVAIMVISANFAGKSRVERSRMVFGIIADEVRQIHAITVMKTLTPEEYEASGGKLAS